MQRTVRRRLVEHLLDPEDVIPAITEVVLVPELVALGGEELVEPYVVLQHAVLALLEIKARDEVRRASGRGPCGKRCRWLSDQPMASWITSCNCGRVRSPG
jgi:hypothetical protein